MSYRLVLYGTSACHLCERAEALLMTCLPPDSYQLKKVDIADDAALMDKYGVLIPVLEHEGLEQNLCWPFDQDKLMDFLATL